MTQKVSPAPRRAPAKTSIKDSVITYIAASFNIKIAKGVDSLNTEMFSSGLNTLTRYSVIDTKIAEKMRV